MKPALVSLLLLSIACSDPPIPESSAEPARIERNLSIGGLTLDRAGRVVSLILPLSGAELVGEPYPAFTLTVGSQERYTIDGLRTVERSFDRAVVELTSSSRPEVLTVQIEERPSSVHFTVLDVRLPNTDPVDGGPLGLDTRFVLPAGFECQLGYIGYTPGSHSCSSAAGTIAAFCRSGNCDNTTRHRAPATDPAALGSLVGAQLATTPLRPLSGSTFVLMTSGHPFRSRAFLDEFKQLKTTYGASFSTGSTLFLTSPPSWSSCGAQFCPESARQAALTAQALGFDELMLADYTWLRITGAQQVSFGVLEPMPDLAPVVRAISAVGVCPMLHTIASLLTVGNALCPSVDCSAALREPSGVPRDRYGYYLLDTNQPQVHEAAVTSVTEGLTRAGACGMYADGSDWFESDLYAAPAYFEDHRASAPQLRLRSNYALANGALFTKELDFQDTWQVDSSLSPRDWAMQHGYFALQGMMENIGIRARLGWVPPPHPTTSRFDYQMMLNSAVATGAHMTIQAGGNDAAISGGRMRWFTTAVRQANDAIRETSAGEALGFLADASARHDLYHFDSGVSTLALFDAIVPAAPGTQLEGRGFGVVSAQGEDCGPFSECFYFTGAERFPDSWEQPLGERGSYLYHPGHPATGSADFTVAFWFKADPSRPAIGSIFEKGLLGYGVYYYEGAIGGHFSGDQPGSYHGIYRPVVDPARPEWHHAAYSYSRAEQSFRFYVDGELSGPVEPVGIYAAPYASTPLFVGSGGTPFDGSNFAGWMNDVRLYDRAIAPEDVRAMVDAVNNEKGAVPDPTDRPVLAWSAGRDAPAAPTVRAELGSQRVVYLVPLLEGSALPSETIQLTFSGLRNPGRARIESAIPVRVVSGLGRTLVVEIDSSSIGIAPVRVAVVE